ncbi:hypothetical protein TNCV_4030481 [Trichonephila clavipes]|nr:hypothetical protein TNCV_4030481 [Trichonephila clavipes]
MTALWSGTKDNISVRRHQPSLFEYAFAFVRDAGCLWETEREAFLHPISRLCMWPDVGGPAWERVSRSTFK